MKKEIAIKIYGILVMLAASTYLVIYMLNN